MDDLIVSIADAALLMGVTDRRVRQLAGEARVGRDQVDLAVLMPSYLADLRERASTAEARRELIRAQIEAKREESRIRRQDWAPTADFRELTTAVLSMLHPWRQQATSAIFYSDAGLPEDLRRRAAYDLDRRLLDEIRRIEDRIETAVADYERRRIRRIDLGVDD